MTAKTVNAREKLIEELIEVIGADKCVFRVADFILADRKRILEPLTDFVNKGYGGDVTANYEISETLKRANLVRVKCQ